MDNGTTPQLALYNANGRTALLAGNLLEMYDTDRNPRVLLG
jgi:hypothetical protein